MKIVWHSNAVWANTGYGVQTALFAPRIAQHYDLALSSLYGLDGGVQTWNGIPVFPGDGVNGNLTLPTFVRHFAKGEPCLLITLYDVWCFQSAELAELDMACWTPVDHDPAPPKVVGVLKALGARPIAMSLHGKRMLENEGLSPLYVPHGVDTNVFRPQEPHVRREVRELLNIPENAFVAGMVAANKGNGPPRKGFPQVFDAFARFEKANDNAYLYLHTEITGKHDGCDLVHLAEQCEIPPHKVKFTPPAMMTLGVQQSDMPALYSIMDVLLNPSYGEGFGVPIIEAQACGIPVAVTDWTAMTELCGAGWLVDGDRWWDPRQRGFFKCPSVKSIEQALRKAHRARGDEALARKAREFALGYDVDRVFEQHWLPVLDELTAVREPSEPRVSVRQAA